MVLAPTFRSLSTRLSVQYAGLFAAVLFAISVILYLSIGQIARISVERQLVASGSVYDRLWLQRSRQMQDAAQLLARDFGFREASATGDSATAASALANLKVRLHADLAVVVDPNGRIIGSASPSVRRDIGRLWPALDGGQYSGVATIDGKARQVAAAPIMVPALAGWILFASDIDAREMHGLERLSAIPLHAVVIVRSARSDWRRADDGNSLSGQASSRIVDGLKTGQAFRATLTGTEMIAFAKALPTMVAGDPAALLLSYPRAQAIGAYRSVQWRWRWWRCSACSSSSSRPGERRAASPNRWRGSMPPPNGWPKAIFAM